MSIPHLGFRRATRKRLRRCAHPDLVDFADIAEITRYRVRCQVCGAELVVSVDPMKDTQLRGAGIYIRDAAFYRTKMPPVIWPRVR